MVAEEESIGNYLSEKGEVVCVYADGEAIKIEHGNYQISRESERASRKGETEGLCFLLQEFVSLF
ncbi:hypothetical protein C5167_033044 [Papaver somniferum]|uniref:Uncharacterized protein n=1 Tax=Papaver somniferum TaxID=3469 RepID=A0A4Y7K875_PAPSO|nr:hypothetical protein C5167_033044 [Papaver somniferum]